MFDGLKALPAQVEAFNISLKSNRPVEVRNDADEDIIGVRSHQMEVPDNRTNEAVNDLFLLA